MGFSNTSFRFSDPELDINELRSVSNRSLTIRSQSSLFDVGSAARFLPTLEGDRRTRSRSRSPRSVPTENTSDEASYLISKLGIDEAMNVPKLTAPMQYCNYCGAEGPCGWPDPQGTQYCDYCWGLWTWSAPEEALKIARQHRWPHTQRWEWVFVDGNFGVQTRKALQRYLSSVSEVCSRSLKGKLRI